MSSGQRHGIVVLRKHMYRIAASILLMVSMTCEARPKIAVYEKIPLESLRLFEAFMAQWSNSNICIRSVDTSENGRVRCMKGLA